MTKVWHQRHTHFSSTASRISGGAGGEGRWQSEKPGSLPSSHHGPGPGTLVAQLTVVQQIADHLLATRTDGMVQERAALLVPVHEVTPSSVQLLELRAGGRAGLGLLRATLLPATEMSPNSQRPQT